jgi:pimeloyl-ACP methyl ester carboxylesterase
MADLVANGVRHHVQRMGTGGAPVVFVHGLVMDNLSSFYFTLATPVATKTEVVLYDLRGHGMSERPPTGYAIADLVADLAALIARLELSTPVRLVGNSFGGTLALACAAAHPALVSAIALIDAHDGATGFADQMSATLSLEGEARDLKIAENFQSWLGRHSERKRTKLARAAEALVHGTSLVADLAASPPVDASRVRCPVMALYGERSDVRACGERLARALPSCTLELVPGCSHSVLWEATALVRERIVEFAAS